MTKTNHSIVKNIKKNSQLIMICLTFFFIIISIIAFIEGLKKASVNVANSFTDTTSETANKVHDAIYDSFYQMAERNHHVSNRGSLTIGDLKKENRLEVYKAVANEFVIENRDDNNYKLTQWVKVTGVGTYTINLSLSEFIIDDENNIIAVRVPDLELETPQTTIKQLFRADDLGLADLNPRVNKTKVGSELSNKLHQEGWDMIINEFNTNPEYKNAAKESAIKIMTCLIKGLNPERPNLKVEVEFINDINK